MTNESAPPALPPRESSPPPDALSMSTPLPEFLPKATMSHSGLPYAASDPMAVINSLRQADLVEALIISGASDIFAAQKGTDIFANQLAAAKQDHAESLSADKFWYDLIDDIHSTLLKNKFADKLEAQIIKGIPEYLRGLVYLKTLNVRYKFNKDHYNALFKRADASASVQSQAEFFEKLELPENVVNILKVYTYYSCEIITTRTIQMEALHSETNISNIKTGTSLPTSFVVHTLTHIAEIPGLEDEEILFILVKLDKLYIQTLKDELFYKINRALEESENDLFIHISKQGVMFNAFYNEFLTKLYNSEGNKNWHTKLLDFIVFEGLDFFIRVVLYIFDLNREKLLLLTGDDLSEFLHSDTFLNYPDIDFSKVVEFDATIIIFENEYNLAKINSIGNNSNELTNLRETGKDLRSRIEEMTTKLSALQTTHTEIQRLNAALKSDLQQSIDHRESLARSKAKLQDRYGNLTLIENVKNAKNANEDIAKVNSELEAQIAAIEKSNALLREKVATIGGSK